MMNRIIILLGLLCTITFFSFGQSNIQCDTIKIFNGNFDKFFQNEYYAIKADTILAIRHCYNTNGCSSTFGLLCWKINGQYYFKKVQERNPKFLSTIKTTSKLSKELKRHLINFYEQKIFTKNNALEEQNEFWIDDGPVTSLLFKTTDKCWRFGYGYLNSKDIRIVWTAQLIAIMKKND